MQMNRAQCKNVAICALISGYALTIVLLMAQHAMAGEAEITITCKKQVCEVAEIEMRGLIRHYRTAAEMLRKKCGRDAHEIVVPSRKCAQRICEIDREDIKALIGRNNDVTEALNRADATPACALGYT